MRQFDEESHHALAVIEQTLAGEAVAPQDAELAELTLILAEQAPEPSPAFAAALDQRVATRFAPIPAEGARGARRQRQRRPWWLASGAAAAMATVGAVVIVASNNGGSSTSAVHGAAVQASTSSASATTPSQAKAPAATGISSSASSTAAAASSPLSAASVPGRQVIRSAQISLSTRPSQVDNVAQQVFTVIADQNGVVESSNVTATNDASGYAQFQLSVPNVNLGAAMAALSRLHGAAVVSRNDVSQDVTGRVGGAGQRLADARAQRSALLRQLAIATTTSAIDSLKLQIRDANASIASDLANLRSLDHQVANSQISLTINASMIAGHHHSSGGLTLGRAAHDAGRVLVLAAGVALIVLAGLVPLALVAAVGLWVRYGLRRRAREQALDTA